MEKIFIENRKEKEVRGCHEKQNGNLSHEQKGFPHVSIHRNNKKKMIMRIRWVVMKLFGMETIGRE